MMAYLLEIERGNTRRVQTRIIESVGMDAVRMYAVEECLTKKGTVRVWKLNEDESKRPMGLVMYSEVDRCPIWATRKEGARHNTLHHIDPKTGKIGRGY